MVNSYKVERGYIMLFGIRQFPRELEIDMYPIVLLYPIVFRILETITVYRSEMYKIYKINRDRLRVTGVLVRSCKLTR